MQCEKWQLNVMLHKLNVCTEMKIETVKYLPLYYGFLNLTDIGRFECFKVATVWA